MFASRNVQGKKKKRECAPLIFLHLVIFCVHKGRLHHIEIINYSNCQAQDEKIAAQVELLFQPSF